MSVLDDAKKATAKVKRMQEQGATAVQAAISTGQELSRSVSAFSSAYPEWIADNGLEEVNHITFYPTTGMAYVCIAAIQRYANYAPDVATNNYCPYPEPDEYGVYPYAYGMLVWPDMRVRDGEVVYKCILPDGTYKLVYSPSQVPSVFEVEE